MAEMEDVTLDGRPLHSLRVADLKAALEVRGLPKSGQKNALIKRLKGALMLENLQKTSASHIGLQPNSQIGEEMSQNSFIKQYLAKQQELLRQRLQREAREAAEASNDVPKMDSSGATEEDHAESSVTSCPGEERTSLSVEVEGKGSAGAEQEAGSADEAETPEQSVPRSRSGTHRVVLHRLPEKRTEAAEPGPASRVVDEQEVPAAHKPGSAHPTPQLSGEEEDNSDEEWSRGDGVRRGGGRILPPRGAPRSRRKQQPPQHIPHPPHQVRQPTPPPSPPPELTFPLPDTPKQSPPGVEEEQQPPQGSSSSSTSSRSSSPEPSQQRGQGALSLLARKMESEGVFSAAVSVAAEAVSEDDEEEESASKDVNLESPPVNTQVEKEEKATEGSGNLEMPAEAMEKSGVDVKGNSEQVEDENMRNCEEMDIQDGGNSAQLEPDEPLGKPVVSEGKGASQHPSKKSRFLRDVHAAAHGGKESLERPQEAQAEKERQDSPRPDTPEDEEEQAGQSGGKAVLPPSPPSEEGEAAPQKERPCSSGSESCSPSLKEDSHSPQVTVDANAYGDSSKAVEEAPHGRIAGPNRKRRAGLEDERDSAQNKKPCPGEAQGMTEEGTGSDQPVSELKPAAASESSDSAGEAEMQPELGSSGGAPLPDCQGEPESGEGHSENSAPKVFPARRISLNTAGKPSAAGGEAETAGQASRKRRWGSSTVVTAKKPSISITTDSLKSLIPEVKSSSGSQEAVVELHADEGHLSEDEEGRGEQNLQIRRTVTQVVPADNQENGSKEAEGEEEEEEEQQPGEENSTTCTEDKKESSSGVAMETQSCSPSHEVEAKKVTPSDSLVRRSISQKKSGVSITIDDPVRVAKQPSPPHGKVSNIVHVSNLVRPFTLGQLKELLSRTGTMLEEGFWIDKIKSHCYVTYSNTEEAMSTRTALHGVKWPQSNPKFLRVDFCEQEELDFHRGLLTVDPKAEAAPAPSAAASVTIPAAPSRSSRRASAASPPPPLMQERERPPRPPGDQWAEREREMERRERARAEREWDRGKVRDFAAKHEEEREGRNRRSRSRDRERRRKERGKSKDRKAEKKEKAPEEPPAKLLDDLFRKTKAAPCIYWLPLTDEQVVQKGVERAERMKEREKKRKELLEEEERKREEERAERLKGRERDGVANLRSNEGERGRERDRGRDSYRNRGVESKPRQGGARRSRSRSNPLRRH